MRRLFVAVWVALIAGVASPAQNPLLVAFCVFVVLFVVLEVLHYLLNRRRPWWRRRRVL